LKIERQKYIDRIALKESLQWTRGGHMYLFVGILGGQLIFVKGQ